MIQQGVFALCATIGRCGASCANAWRRLDALLVAGLALLLCASEAAAQTAACPASQTGRPYEANWSSLNARPTPNWWTDAKFGIFIHWGVYSAPAYAPVGEYAEWYGFRLGERTGENEKDRKLRQATQAFHRRVYGETASYADFAPRFTAELFDPKDWARIFRQSGARYVVLTSKHHDGFALWPSEEATRSWGRPWNAVDAGPKRDLLGELSAAVRGEGLQMGYYYSLYEWSNPLYRPEEPAAYVDRHMLPQLKDLVRRYQPSVIFADGEWDAPADAWRSEQFLQWLFNESPVCGHVVINDRWGRDGRHRNGGYYTTEYGSGLPDASHPWEESRGIGSSYGFNRVERLEDYATGHRLVLQLIDTVSRGGNFLLNVGPDADGTIPVVMEDRLSHIGRWLRHNGEAIYGTTMFRSGAQWGEGREQALDLSSDYRTTYDVETLLLRPEPGMARKEVLFTQKPGAVFAITPIYPDGVLRLKGMTLGRGGRVTLLGSDRGALRWRNSGGDLLISAPPLRVGELPFDDAYTFKLEGVREA